MNNIFSYYGKYREHIDEYNSWNKQQDADSKQVASLNSLSSNETKLKQKAKAIAEPILLLDSYTHEKAEDSETFYQTYNTELMSVTSLLCLLPISITKAIPFFNKHAETNNLAKKAGNILTKYANASVNLMGRNISAPKLTTVISAIGAGLFFAKGIKNSIEGQLGLTRKASFDATQNITNNHKMFAILTPEQEAQLDSIVKHNEEHQTAFVDKLKDKVDIRSSFKSVKEYSRTKSEYSKQKENYFKEINTIPNKNLSQTSKKQAEEDKQLFQNLLKNMEHDVLEPLRKVETLANISYSALFAGGFLEYLITDKLVDVLKVKNKPLRGAMKIGVPLISYLLLNKNISDFENKAILATKYKHLKQFTENPQQYTRTKKEQESLPQFLRTIAKDMKDYDTFAEKELPKIKERLEAKQQINLSEEQEKEAKILQKNTNMVVNTQREQMFEQTVGIEVFSETVTNPIDILGAAIGGKIGHTLSKNCPNKKLSGLMTFIGTVIGFVPVAIMEAKFTKEQKKAEKIATMLTMKDLDNKMKFADFSQETANIDFNFQENSSKIFKDFIK